MFFGWGCITPISASVFTWALSLSVFNCTHREELWSVGIKNPLKDKAVDYSYHQSRRSHQHTKKHCIDIACWQNCALKGGYLQAILDSLEQKDNRVQCCGVGKMLNRRQKDLMWNCEWPSMMAVKEKSHNALLSFPMMELLSSGKPSLLLGSGINWWFEWT